MVINLLNPISVADFPLYLSQGRRNLYEKYPYPAPSLRFWIIL